MRSKQEEQKNEIEKKMKITTSICPDGISTCGVPQCTPIHIPADGRQKNWDDKCEKPLYSTQCKWTYWRSIPSPLHPLHPFQFVGL